jgi:hypothetical protein
MKRLAPLAAVVLIAAGHASAANAGYVFSPADTVFTISGSIEVGYPPGEYAVCPLGSMTKVKTNRPGRAAKISMFALECDGPLSSMNLPWTMEVTGANTANIIGMAFATEGETPCGPATVPVTFSGTGAMTIPPTQMAGSCNVRTTNGPPLQSKPAITVVPK